MSDHEISGRVGGKDQEEGHENSSHESRGSESKEMPKPGRLPSSLKNPQSPILKQQTSAVPEFLAAGGRRMSGALRKISLSNTSGFFGNVASPASRPLRSDSVQKIHSIWWALDNLPPSMLIGKEKQENERKQRQRVPKTIIHPGSRFRLVWDLIALAFLLYFMFAVPFRLCFVDTQVKDKQLCAEELVAANCDALLGCAWDELEATCIKGGKNMLVFWFDSIVDIFFMIDICLNFRTAYTVIDDRGGTSVETDGLKIAVHYLRTWFLFDLVGSLPLDLIFFIIGQDEQDTQDLEATGDSAGESVLIGLHRLLRFAKAFRLLKLMRAVRIRRIVEELQDTANINPGVFRVMQFIFMFLFVAHIMACILFLLGTMGGPFRCLATDVGQCAPESQNEEDRFVTWITRTPMMTRQAGEVVVADAPIDTQCAAPTARTPSSLAMYIISLYWAITIMTTVGFGDIKPLTTHEVITVIFCMLVGASTFSYVVGNMASLITNLDSNAGAFQERLEQVSVFLHDNSVPRDLRARIRRYYEYAFAHPQVDLDHAALQELSPSLRKELLRLLRKNILASVILFRTIPAEAKDRVLPSLLDILVPSQHGPGDRIFNQKELGRHVVLVFNGEVDILEGQDEEELVATLGQGSCFGETALIPGYQRRPYTARCRTWCDLLWLDARELDVRLQEVPNAASAVRLTASVRWERMEGAMAAHRVIARAKHRGLELTGKELLEFIAKVGAQDGWERGVNLSNVDGGNELYSDIKELMWGSAGGRALMREARERFESSRLGEWSWSSDWVDGQALETAVWDLSRRWGGALLAERELGKEMEGLGLGPKKADGPILAGFTSGFESVGFLNSTMGGGLGSTRLTGGRVEGSAGGLQVGRAIRGIDAEADEIAPGVDLDRTLHEMVKRIDVIEVQLSKFSASEAVARLSTNVRAISRVQKHKAEAEMAGSGADSAGPDDDGAGRSQEGEEGAGGEGEEGRGKDVAKPELGGDGGEGGLGGEGEGGDGERGEEEQAGARQEAEDVPRGAGELDAAKEEEGGGGGGASDQPGPELPGGTSEAVGGTSEAVGGTSEAVGGTSEAVGADGGGEGGGSTDAAAEKSAPQASSARP